MQASKKQHRALSVQQSGAVEFLRDQEWRETRMSKLAEAGSWMAPMCRKGTLFYETMVLKFIFLYNITDMYKNIPAITSH